MITTLTVCAVALTVAVIVAVVFLIKTLIQIDKASREAEILLKSANHEVNSFVKITDSVSDFLENIGSPWLKFGGFLSGLLTYMVKANKRGARSGSGAGKEEKDKVAVGSV